MAVRLLVGMISAAALAVGLVIGASFGAYLVGVDEEAVVQPAVRTIAVPEGRPAALEPRPQPTPIGFDK